MPLSPSTRFIAVAGPPCSGKSTVARRLSQALSAPHLEMDRFRARILPSSDQRVEDRDIAYNAMHLTAELLVRWCRTVVTDATYTAAQCRQSLLDVVDRTGGELVVVQCRIGPRAAAERFSQRGSHPAVDLTSERVELLAAAYPYFAHALDVDADSDVDRIVERIQSAVALEPSARVAWATQGTARDVGNRSNRRTATVT